MRGCHDADSNLKCDKPLAGLTRTQVAEAVRPLAEADLPAQLTLDSPRLARLLQVRTSSKSGASAHTSIHLHASVDSCTPAVFGEPDDLTVRMSWKFRPFHHSITWQQA